MARTFAKLLTGAFERTGFCAALLSGGVSGSPLLRRLLGERLRQRLYYAADGLSSDNAVGTALLARDRFNNGR
jgi:tRNA A37 threonylcarbamoyltransferase TsaD